ncbi:MAG: hypothetical protein B6I24_00015 [Bacteroidetes bacterium 4572_128]|nr:MAG: hypothetical protein B6I24_00015 [Bacteroidetes bacterium 4572_128]
MKNVKNFKLNSQFNIIVISFLILVFIIFGYFIYDDFVTKAEERKYKNLKKELENICDFLNYSTVKRIEKLNDFQKITHKLFYQNGDIEIIDSITTTFNAFNQISKKSHEVEVNLWKQNGIFLQKSDKFINEVEKFGVETVTIFQKIDKGFLRIATNILDDFGNKAIGTYIPNNSIVVKTLKKNETYKGKAFVLNKYYTTIYEPIKINNKIVGALLIGISEIDYTSVKNFFDKRTENKNKYPFLVKNNGELLIHPDFESENISSTNFFRKEIEKNLKENYFQYFFPDNELGFEKTACYKYLDNLDAYVFITTYDEAFYKRNQKTMIYIILIFSIFIFLFFVILHIIFSPIKKYIYYIYDIIYDISQGKILDEIKNKNEKYFNLKILKHLNILIKSLKRTYKFTQEIQKGNFKSDYKLISKDDVLGKSLMDMRNSLEKAKKDATERKREDDIRNWESKGQAEFSEILRQDNDNLKKMSENIIVYITKYLKANQGGLFIIKNKNKNDAFIEQISCFAYDRKRQQKKRIRIDDGLLGRSVYEKETIYLTNIPKNYINITSGLGDETPNNLLIVPLKLNEKVLGILELASFRIFEKYEIEFLERVGENIASVMSSAQTNEETKKLLIKAKEQAEIMLSQDEEMRQNLEEMQATQDEAIKKENLAKGFIDSVNNFVMRANFDLEGNIIFANKLFLEKLGYKKFIEIKNFSYYNFFEKKDLLKIKSIDSSLQRGGKFFEGTIKHITKNNKLIDLFVIINIIRDKNFKPEYILFLIIDKKN